MMIRITELEETISSISLKLSGVEKQKSRLSQEIEILILDLEKVRKTSAVIEKSQGLLRFLGFYC